MGEIQFIHSFKSDCMFTPESHQFDHLGDQYLNLRPTILLGVFKNKDFEELILRQPYYEQIYIIERENRTTLRNQLVYLFIL